MRPIAFAALAFTAAFVACARERVEVGESADDDAGAEASTDGGPPLFPPNEGGLDARATSCGPPPVIGRCLQPCPTGYVTLPDGGQSCECCP